MHPCTGYNFQRNQSEENVPWSWIPSSNGNIPEHVVESGLEADSKLYVARGKLDSIWIPGKFDGTNQKCYISWRGKEHVVANYEILIDPHKRLRWIPSSQGLLVVKAVLGGVNEVGETFFIGRAWHNGANTPGRIHPSHRVCYIPSGGKEQHYVTYQILVSS
ncbi:unnamed protein product [Allacma fusca]|uniref:Uncharacterized protein n=1 Tax=Allacma fusca TaxID=39272 RepID=A0A8J2JN00_9HEXA|nr:unnamed protein product [Allacma fusca]